jgi:hypothetical protein
VADLLFINKVISNGKKLQNQSSRDKLVALGLSIPITLVLDNARY